MSFLRNLLGRRNEESGPDLAVNLNVEARRDQLTRLEAALDELVAALRTDTALMANPGWRERVAEYGRAAGAAMTLRQAVPTREGILDLVFEIRPVFTGTVSQRQEYLVPLQDKVLAIVAELQEFMPGERA